MPAKYKILVCKGPDCGEKRHSIDVFHALDRELKRCPLNGNEVVLEQYACFGKCAKGPNVLVREVLPNESRMLALMPTMGKAVWLYHAVSPGDARRIVEEHIAKGTPIVAFTLRTP